MLFNKSAVELFTADPMCHLRLPRKHAAGLRAPLSRVKRAGESVEETVATLGAPQTRAVTPTGGGPSELPPDLSVQFTTSARAVNTSGLKA